MSSLSTVVVTGLGVISPLGIGWRELWEAILRGQSGVGPITRFSADGFPTRIAAEVKAFDPVPFLGRKESRRMDLCTQYAVAAASLALEDAGLSVPYGPAERIGVCVGSGIGGMSTFEAQHQILLERGAARVSPFFIPMMIPNMPAGQISLQFGFKGPNFSIVSACATGAGCLAGAMDMIRLGRADIVLAGGTEATITPLGVGGFCAMKALSTRNEEPTRASRPFDRERDGFVMGEGAGILVLERLETALARGARIHGELAGYGLSADAHHMTSPDPQGAGALRAMTMALEDAGLTPDSIDYVNAHGTSTPVGDPCETRALRALFGPRAAQVAVSSTKSMLGHTLGAAGALETILSLLATAQDLAPPTINLEFPDPECDLDYVPQLPRRLPIRAALNNSFGFGGQNAVIVVRKHEGSPG